MKLSSVSLIATALAAITASAIAAPGSLRARALENVNSFSERDGVYSRESGLALLEREVDGEFVDDLFMRSIAGSHQAAVARGWAAATCEWAALAGKEATKKADEAGGKASELAWKARKAAQKATTIADRARVAADVADSRAKVADSIQGVERHISEHLRNLDKAAHHDNLAAYYTKEAATYHTEAVDHMRNGRLQRLHGMDEKHASDAHDHGSMAVLHNEDTEALRRGSANQSQKDRANKWKRSKEFADTSRAEAEASGRASHNAIRWYDHAIRQYDTTVVHYDNAIAEHDREIALHDH